MGPAYNCQIIKKVPAVPLKNTMKTREKIVKHHRMEKFGFTGNHTEVEMKLYEILNPIVAEWSGQPLEDQGVAFGIRRYLRGAWMSLHVDRLPTHVLSAILQ